MSTHNISSCREIRKLFIRYPPFSRPMGLATLLVSSFVGPAGHIENNRDPVQCGD